MEYLTKEKYLFSSKAPDVSDETFGVVSFKGVEAISKPYRFEITLVSDNHEIDPLVVLQNPALFTILRQEGGNVEFNGILKHFEEIQEFNGYRFFEAVLTPKLWWLSLTHHNQVFLDMTIPEIMESALKDAGLMLNIDFQFNLMNTYQKIEYVCQYDESHFNFVSRWAQREGIYYFFEQTENGEKVIFTDTKIIHTDLLFDKNLFYHPQSGLDSLYTSEVIKSFKCRHNLLPLRVYLKDYNYLKPSLVVEGFADVDENGRGENYIYGEHFDSVEEGNRLAAIRAQELSCRKSLFYGESSVPFMVPGYTFNLKEHYSKVYNRKYLICEVTHEGHQTGYLVSAISAGTVKTEEDMFYANSFTAIYSDVQFRPLHEAVKPKISGTLNAKIDAAASGQYAEVDDQGRYKVILPFDRSGRFGGKASAWFRMMQPYAGQNQGMHFPLHKGTEVMLTFVDGDPDRPLIAGAVPNPETSSPISSANQTRSVIKTGKNPVDNSVGAAEYARGGSIADSDPENYIEFEDLTDSERIRIHSDGDIWSEAQNRYAEYTMGGPDNEADVPEGLKYLWKKFYDSSPAFDPDGLRAYSYPSSATGSDPSVDTTSMATLARTGKVQLAKGDSFNTQDGNIYDFGGYWNYNLGNSYVEDHLLQSPQQADLTDDAEYAHNQNRGVLNKDNIAEDLLDTGGPNWTEVTWSKAYDGSADSALSDDDVKIGSFDNQWKNSNGIWVGKQFGDSYSYTEGDAISVTKGSSLEIQHGGKHIDIVFRGSGAIKSWSWQDGAHKKERKWTSGGKKWYEMEYEDGITNETVWNPFSENDDLPKLSQTTEDKNTGIKSVHTHCRDTGNIIAYSSQHQGFNSVHSFDFKWANTASASFTFAASAAFSFSAAASASINVAAGVDFELKTGLGMGLELDLRAGGTFKLKPSGGLKFDGIGFTARKKAALDAAQETLKAQQTSAAFHTIMTKLANNTAKIEKKQHRSCDQ